jgi:hypothetical protein
MQNTYALTRLALDLNWSWNHSFWLLALGGAVRVGGSLRLKKHDPRTGEKVAAQ